VKLTLASALIAFASLVGLASPAIAAPIDHYAFEMGDDNGDGVVQEDESGWSCVDQGNRTCGLGNSNGVPAGCYDDGGVIVAPWPCYVVVNADGSSDVFN
jgi:hypothetical protein